MSKSAPKKTASSSPSEKKTAPKTARKGAAEAANDQPQKQGNARRRATIVIIAGLIIVAGILALNAGSLAKQTIEKIASDTLGVTVTIAALDINLQESEIRVSGIKVANPQGYKGQNAFTIDQVNIAAKSISREKLVLDKVQVSGTRINLEVLPDRTNLIEIHGNLDRAASTKDTGEKPVRIVARETLIENAVLHPAITLAGGEMNPVTLPDIRITNIGNDANGMLASEAMTAVAERVITVAMHKAVEQRYLQGMENEALYRIESALGFSSGFLKNFGSKVKGIFGN